MSEQHYDLDWLRAHREECSDLYLKIVTKSQGLQPLRLNYTQRLIRHRIAELRAKGVPPRLIILKSRQVGVSTYSVRDLFLTTLLDEYRAALVLSRDRTLAKILLGIARTLYDNVPEWLKSLVPEKTLNVNEIGFKNGSRMQVAVQGEVRGYTAQAVLLSEFAFFLRAKETLIAVMQSVPRDVNSLAIIESTANGVGGQFHSMWVNAIRGRSDEDAHESEKGWYPIFVPWYRHEEYSMHPRFKPNSLTKTERELAARFKLTLGQIAWRRWCIKFNLDGDEDSFKVEYPSSWGEAFALSGRPVFSPEALGQYRREIEPLDEAAKAKTLWITSEPSEIEWNAETKKPLIVPMEGGHLRIFKPFNPRHTYIIGVDPSEGDTKSDPSPIEVLDQMGPSAEVGKLEQVAEWWGRTPPDLLADIAWLLGLYYGVALIIGEANNQGIAFHNQLIYRNYPNIYFRETSEETVSGKPSMKPGWFETSKAKHALFDTGRKAIRERKIILHSPGLLSELETSVYEQKERYLKSKIRPQAGHHIDRVIALLMALYAHRNNVTLPLLPLPEKDILDFDQRIGLLRERDPERAEKETLDLMHMTGAQFDAFLERRAEIERRRQANSEAFET